MEEDVKGLAGLLADLGKLPLTMGKLIIVRSLRKAVEPIETRIAQLAPDDPETSGSQIRENIASNITDQTATGAIALIGPTKKGFVAGFAELGTAHQPARPFIGPGFDQTYEDAIDIFVEEIGDSTEKELKKLG